MITINGKQWQIHSEKQGRMVLKPAKNPLKKWFADLNKTEREAAKVLDISQASFHRYLNGDRVIPERVLKKLASN